MNTGRQQKLINILLCTALSVPIRKTDGVGRYEDVSPRLNLLFINRFFEINILPSSSLGGVSTQYITFGTVIKVDVRRRAYFSIKKRPFSTLLQTFISLFIEMGIAKKKLN